MYKIKQKIFSIGDKFYIKDNLGIERYKVTSKIFTFSKKLCIESSESNEKYYIEEKIISFLPKYEIYQNKQLLATVKKEFTLFKAKFKINSKYGNFDIRGSVLGYNFNIYNSKKEVCRVSKDVISFSDTYFVDILEEDNHGFYLALVIIIDQVIHSNNSKANNN